MTTKSLLWHDYETWGLNPREDTPSQFAAIRTDLELNIIEEPIMIYATPPVDRLINPMACLVTRQTPQRILAQDCLSEFEFIKKINSLMSQPGTCTVGYNNLRFDDEVTRFTLYRNLMDPYAREWQNNCSRWDLLDVLRVARTLRPEGINWPTKTENDKIIPSMRLEDLSKANNIEHENAHDALADVYATIAMAKLLKKNQPKLYDYVFSNRDKKSVSKMLNIIDPKMVLHFSGVYPMDQGNMAVVAPIAQDPTNKNAIVVFDLSKNIDILYSDDIEYLHYLLFTKNVDLKPDETRLPIKTIHINKCPVITPINTLAETVKTQYEIDLSTCQNNLDKLKKIANLEHKIQQILQLTKFDKSNNPEISLYDGFISNYDRGLCNQIINADLKNIDTNNYKFKDSKLKELSFRFKARNYPNSLSTSEKSRWQKHCKNNILNGESTNLETFKMEMLRINQEMDLSSADQKILVELEEWLEILTTQHLL